MPSSSRPRRVYCRDWKPQTRSIRGSVSLPRLQLISSTRPFFECPTCFSSNDRVPVCLWCKGTSTASAAAFKASMPKQRTVSAPMKVTFMDVSVSYPPARVRSAEIVSKPHGPTIKGATLSRTLSTRASSLADKSNTFTCLSVRTSTSIDADAKAALAYPMVVDEMGQLPTPPDEGKFHTLPLRRKGHILRTTAGVVVNKSRLSALFRKDAVPLLDKHIPPAETPRKTKPRASMDGKDATVRSRRSKRAALSTLPTIPSSVPLDVPPRPSVPPDAAPFTPMPPSFLSPFWYRPEEFGRLPASPPASRATSLDTARPATLPRVMHAHSRSEPFPIAERPSPEAPSSPAWKRRMSGFFRHSVSVVTGQKAIH